ncbi:MAG TPA: hypothetical protein DIU15_18605 [Deltaproteobacteria bacterium]|nr:hypothetical protein [Deltaproteobacteria bacterium]HCP48057.1 hypothetical protein [Deltaproteobacteria bacterium]
MNCPKCPQSPLRNEHWEGVDLDRCLVCGGLFLDPGELEGMLTSFSGGWADDSRYSAISNQQDMQLGSCPRCTTIMTPYLSPRNIRLDRCGSCGGLFLDQGELAAMRREVT